MRTSRAKYKLAPPGPDELLACHEILHQNRDLAAPPHPIGEVKCRLPECSGSEVVEHTEMRADAVHPISISNFLTPVFKVLGL